MDYSKWCAAVWELVKNDHKVQAKLEAAREAGYLAGDSGVAKLVAIWDSAPRDAWREVSASRPHGPTPAQAARQALAGLWD